MTNQANLCTWKLDDQRLRTICYPEEVYNFTKFIVEQHWRRVPIDPDWSYTSICSSSWVMHLTASPSSVLSMLTGGATNTIRLDGTESFVRRFLQRIWVRIGSAITSYKFSGFCLNQFAWIRILPRLDYSRKLLHALSIATYQIFHVLQTCQSASYIWNAE